jgi:hypothetical protein
MMKLARPVRAEIEFSGNTDFVNKPINNYSITYSSRSGEIDDLSRHIKKGYSFCCAHFKKNERKLENIIHCGLVGFDIDNTGVNKFTLEDWANTPWLVQYTKYYTTCSHTEEHHRFRLLLPLPQAVGIEQYKAIWDYLDKMTNNAGDPATKHPAVPYYGNTNAVFSDNEIEGLPWDFMDQMDKEAEIMELKNAEIKATQAQKALNFDETKPELAEIASALGFLSSDCSYSDWTRIICGIGHGTGWSEDGFILADNWSASSPKYDGTESVYRKWCSFRDTPSTVLVTVGTLFHMAQDNGWVRGVAVKKPEIVDDNSKYTSTYLDNARFVADMLKELYKDWKGGVIGIKSPKNTGKSYFLKRLIESEKKSILNGDRCRLMDTLSDETGSTYINQHYDNEDAKAVYSEYGSIACVLDSVAKKLDGLCIVGGVLIIDEAEQFMSSLASGDTEIKNVRGKTYLWYRGNSHLFETILLCDANLTDRTVNFWGTMSNKPVYKYENIYRENNRTLFLHSSKADLQAQMETDIAQGKKVMYVSDSQAQGEALHRNFLKMGVKSLLLTRDSMDEKPELKHYISNKGEKIRREEIQVVLASPVIQSGISIELDEYFSAVYGNFCGVIPPQTACQMLMRVRGNCPRHVYSVMYGNQVPQLFTAEDVEDNESEKKETVAEMYEWALSEGLATNAKDFDSKSLNEDKFYQFIMKHRSEVIAAENRSRYWFQPTLIDQLKEDGYKLTYIETKKKAQIDVKEELELMKIEEATRIASAQLVSEDEKQRLEKKETLNHVEKAQLSKAILHSTLPNFPQEFDTDFVHSYVVKDNYKIIRSVENSFLIENRDHCFKRDDRAIKTAVKNCPSMPLLTDVRTKSQLIALWDRASLSSLRDKEITSNTLSMFKDWALKNKKLLRMFKIGVKDNNYGITLMKKVFAIFGYEVNKLKSGTSGRVYVIEKVALFDEFYNSIQTRYIQNEEKRVQKEKEKAEAEMKKLSNWYGGSLKRKTTLSSELFVFNDHFS